MTQTLEIINIAVLAIIITYAFKQPIQRHAAQKKKKQDDEEIQLWENGADIASRDKEYRAFVHDITGLGKDYDPDQWYYKMPESAIKHLNVCFDNDQRKVNAMRRAIELSIEHYTHEMEDDAQCARIIYERTVLNPQQSVPFDIEEYKKYREERIEKEGTFESLEEWRIRMSPENGEEKKEEDSAS
ncbi:MAG TPA: hypothetical protein PLM93_11865 [Sulfuricurvum sp.]|nr:MAG: hypothetical protein B7Y30_11080 [Campylobacterales bacterium 16-40-21]OZA02043.1 MAG: hypothetical protein B7X89_11005 [Sulfuricurvum sp. 17-40-25]HQS67872.1 hypothetical protein [Sulfuricurvum sp.]HQT37272.1 hypothetical protein [Sulfuricurvum sp.]